MNELMAQHVQIRRAKHHYMHYEINEYASFHYVKWPAEDAYTRDVNVERLAETYNHRYNGNEQKNENRGIYNRPYYVLSNVAKEKLIERVARQCGNHEERDQHRVEDDDPYHDAFRNIIIMVVHPVKKEEE